MKNKQDTERDDILNGLPWSIAIISDMFYISVSFMPIVLLSASIWIARLFTAVACGITIHGAGKLALPPTSYLSMLSAAATGFLIYAVAWEFDIIGGARLAVAVVTVVGVVCAVLSNTTPISVLSNTLIGLGLMVGFISPGWAFYAEEQAEQIIKDYYAKKRD